MGRRRPAMAASSFFLIFLFLQQTLITAQSSSWKTLNGKPPAIVAKGGFSGLFPDSSYYAYSFALAASSSATILLCDVRLTKDGVGICLPDIKLDNCTDISQFYTQGQKTYLVNGVNTTGWFSVDYNTTQLQSISLTQSIWSRSFRFDASMLPILSVNDVVKQTNATSLWLNIQHDSFYTQHKLNMTNYVLNVVKSVPVNYISSPELSFLSGIRTRFSSTKTKLIFRFLDKSIIEPSTKETYGSLLSNLTFIKSVAAGILVPKTYIWPVTSDNYLRPSTSIVADAHKAGLEIHAADFANDNLFSYNYSYDPVAEVLSYVDNEAFSVDGVVSDYPITPSEAIECYSGINKSSIDHGKPYVITHNGASGDYPDCTDLAYTKSVDAAADFIDCPVQVTQDEVPICMSSIDLIPITTVTSSPYSSRASHIPQVQSTAGIFTFNLTWEEIQNLKPTISRPFAKYPGIVRNPRYKNSGTFMKLTDFLAFAKDSPLAGVLISIEDAKFMAENLNYNVIDGVISALNETGYSNQTAQKVMIHSSSSSLLEEFKQQNNSNYKLVYKIDETISDADASSIVDIKAFAHAVALSKDSIFPASKSYTTGQTNVVRKLQKAGLEVYAYLFQNEFLGQPWDFFSDATVEINAYVATTGAGVDGIITEFPATARAYKRNSCKKLGSKAPAFSLPIQPGGLEQLLTAQAMPPALPPSPVLNASDVVEPPFPNVTQEASAPSAGTTTSPPKPSSALRRVASLFITLAAAAASLLLA